MKSEEISPKKVRTIFTSLREEVIVMRVGMSRTSRVGGTQMIFL